MDAHASLDGLSCQQIFELLSEYLDAELPPDLCEKMKGHIEGCAPCVEFVDSLRQSIAICREFKPKTLPAPLAEETKTRLKKAYESLSENR